MKAGEDSNSVLIVDDTELNVEILSEALKDLYEIRTASDGETALLSIEKKPPDIILLDIVMPGMNGYEVCQRLKENPQTAEIPVIFLTAMTNIGDKTKGFEMGAVDYIVKPFAILEVLSRINVHLSLLNAKKALQQQNELLEIKVVERTQELALTQDMIVEAMASLAETRDSETGGHIMRTRYFVQTLAQNLKDHPNFSEYFKQFSPDEIAKAAPLHDIGKVGVPDCILLKPAKLSPEEFEEIKKHTIYGHNILKKLAKRLPNSLFLRLADEIALGHHERWDGKGYPSSLAGTQIPIPARLMAIADVYDALTSARVYKPPMSHSDALELICSERATHFDPDITDIFVKIQDQIQYIAETLADH